MTLISAGVAGRRQVASSGADAPGWRSAVGLWTARSAAHKPHSADDLKRPRLSEVLVGANGLDWEISAS